MPHTTVVADVHALLPHTSAAVSEAVVVGSTTPKLSPLIVMVPPPLGAAFAETDTHTAVLVRLPPNPLQYREPESVYPLLHVG